MPLVTEKLIQAAFDYLHERGEDAAQAKADLIIAEYRRKKARAQAILASSRATMALKEADAELDQAYELAIEEEASAAKNVEWHRHQRARAEAVIEAWRSEQATQRNISRVA